MRIIHKIILVLLIGTIGCKGKNAPSEDLANTTDNQTGKIQLTEINGRSFNLEQYRGKTIFINFWATWCRPCLAEMPSIQRMMKKLEREDIVFFFASNEPPGQIAEFKNRYPFPFHFVRVENFEELEIMALPTTIILNPSGGIVFREQGFREWDNADNLELLLKIAKSV